MQQNKINHIETLKLELEKLFDVSSLESELVQDISDEDCMREGIMKGDFTNTWDKFYFDIIGDCVLHKTFPTAKAAFAALIDKISGKGTWQRNPWVFVYDFELVKQP